MKTYALFIIAGLFASPAFGETAHQALQLRTSKDFHLRFKVDSLIEGIDKEEKNDVRDPFWPVGYAPASGEPAPVVQEVVEVPIDEGLTAEDQAIIKSKLRTTGLVKRGSKKFAVVNNQLVSVGDVVKVAHKGETYRFKVSGFNKGSVVVETKWEESHAKQDKEQEENDDVEATKS